MTLNEAKRAKAAYMYAKAGDLPSQVSATLALFTLVEQLLIETAYLRQRLAQLEPLDMPESEGE